jgi:hypothetical protein
MAAAAPTSLSEAASTIARLEAEVAALKSRASPAFTTSFDLDAIISDADSSSHFQAVDATNCYGVKPCLHSSAAERVKAGCEDSMWDGHFGDHATRYIKEQPPNGSGVSWLRPVAPRLDERFRSVVEEQCDMSDVWVGRVMSRMTHQRHVTVAAQTHWHQRLRGVKNSLWLSIGSSIDHAAMKEACAGFGAERIHLDVGKTEAYPESPGLWIDHCRIKELELTLAHVGSNGICTTVINRNQSVQRTRFLDIDASLRRAGLTREGPRFISFGGIEWDFKNWRCDFPKTHKEWRVPVATLHVQLRAARAVWPSLLVAFSRTMFVPTYGTFGCSCCANETTFNQYNELLRRLSRPSPAAAASSAAAAAAAATTTPLRHLGAHGGGGEDTSCAPSTVHVLDLRRMMLCNNSVGSCSSRSGWSVDGLHPSRAVMLQFVSLSLQAAADLGEYCGSSAQQQPAGPAEMEGAA